MIVLQEPSVRTHPRAPSTYHSPFVSYFWTLWFPTFTTLPRVGGRSLLPGERLKQSRRLELEPVRRARRLVVLQVDGAAGGGRGQVYLELFQRLLVLGDPVTEHVGVVRGNDGHFCNWKTNIAF